MNKQENKITLSTPLGKIHINFTHKLITAGGACIYFDRFSLDNCLGSFTCIREGVPCGHFFPVETDLNIFKHIAQSRNLLEPA